MKQKKLISLGVFILILFIPSFIHSKSHYYYLYSPNTDIYFGHISYTQVKYDGKDPVVIRDGEKEAEVAVLNFPLAPGDTIRTTESRRCEIQFDTGTIIRLDLATELKIETILAQSLSSRKKITNLVLNKGQIYIMYKRYSLPEVFQLITPNAAVKMKHKTVAVINAREDGSTDIQLKLGKAYVVYGPDENSITEKKLNKLERLTISKDHQALQGEYKQDVDFELWNESMNENFQELHKGKNFIPQPIQKYPKAVFYFAQKYSNLHGEWVWNSLYGWVWRPNYNDYYPWGTWQPYFYGQWREVNNRLFWVPEESWGWVPYHLGLWIWDKKLGWLWIPGSAFAPAWATWDFFQGYYAWRPWSLWDWYGGYGASYYPYGYGYYYYGDQEGKKGDRVLRVISAKQLRKKKSSSYSMDKKIKNVYKNVISALNKGDERVIASIKNTPKYLVFVKGKDLNAPRIQEKIIKFGQISKQIESSTPQNKIYPSRLPLGPHIRAALTFKRNKEVALLKEYVISSFTRGIKRVSIMQKDSFISRRKTTISPESGVDSKKVAFSKEKAALGRRGNYVSPHKAKAFKPQSSMRFRDWNPDVKTAQRRGVEISYSSRTNEIRCPALGLSSRNVVSRGSLSSRGGSHSYGSGSSSGSSGGSSGGGSRGGSSSSGGSSKGGGGVKK